MSDCVSERMRWLVGYDLIVCLERCSSSRGIVMELPRRKFLHLATGAVALPAWLDAALALDYPTRPVHLIVGFPAGFTPDIIARLTAQALSERLGKQIIVDNRAGAASNIGTELVVRALPDGYTLLLATGANAINATFYENLGFDFSRDIAPVASIVRSPLVVTVNPSVPASTIPEFIAFAKANPGNINMASGGVGSTPHAAGELFKMMAGVDLVHVPYRANNMPDFAEHLQTRCAGDGKSAKLASSDVPDHSRYRSKHHLYLSGEQIGHVVCAVRDVHQINTGHHLEQLARGMRRAADTT